MRVWFTEDARVQIQAEKADDKNPFQKKKNKTSEEADLEVDV